eukprot:9238499-Pyramimonas_sp.AAC.1
MGGPACREQTKVAEGAAEPRERQVQAAKRRRRTTRRRTSPSHPPLARSRTLPLSAILLLTPGHSTRGCT